MKKILTLVLTICLLLSAIPFTSLNVNAEVYNSFVYVIDNGKAEITGCHPYYIESFGDVVVPSTLGGYPVTAIHDRAFWNCDDLTSLKIQGNTIYIGDEAFSDCDKLKSVTLSCDSVEMGEYVFSSCDLLESVTIEDGLSYVGDYTFYSCESLKSVVLPETVLNIANFAFAECSSLNTVSFIGSDTTIGSVVLPESILHVGDGAFSGCSSLNRVTFLGSDTTIGSGVFSGCSSLFNVSLPSKLTEISKALFSGAGITSINLPSTVKSIGERAYQDCKNLSIADIPQGVETIGDMAFQFCTFLIYVNIPESVTRIGEAAFIRNDDSFGIYVDDDNKNYSDIDGVLFDKEQKKLIYYPTGKINANYEVPESVTSISGYAFYGCMSLKNITIGNSVTNIGEHTFDSCAKLTSIIIPSSLKTVGRQAFWCCYSLADVWYKGSADNKSSISINANNAPLTDATWHYNTCVNEHTYSYNCDADCDNCGWVRIPDEHLFDNNCDIDCNDCGETREAPHTYDNACDSVCNECQAEREVEPHVYDNACDESCNECNDMRVAPHTYDNACDSICNECQVEREVAPHVYDNICDESCNECGEMREVPHVYDNACDSICNECEYVRKVGAHIYDNNCDTICNICKAERVITHKYDDIYDQYCNICNELRENPTGITGDCTWTLDGTNLIISGNGGMGDFTSSDTNSKPWGREITSVVFEEGVTHIGSYAFDNCYYLGSITIPDSVTSIGYKAFSCTGYYNDSSNWENDVLYIGNHLIEAKTSISGSYIIKTGTKTIADYAFSYCFSLNQITIPNSVTSIGGNVFRGDSLISIDVDVNNTEYALQDGVLFNKNKTLLICYPAGKTEESYIVPDSVISIGESAFCNCTSLTSVTIPDSVMSIGYEAFYNCNSLECINLPFVGNTINGTLDTHFGYIFGASSGAGDNYVPKSLKKVTITKATKIDEDAFAYCKSLTNITISDSVTSIGDDAFCGCSGLSSLTIGNAVASIGKRAFYNCSSLTYVEIPDSVTSIGDDAFLGCSSLTSITIPDSVTSIGNYAFKNCISLTSATIGNSVTSIGDGAFYECSSLTSITIPNSVTRIGGYAFYGCSRLESITLPFVGSSRTASGTYDAVFGYIFGYTSSSSTGTTRQYYSSSSYYDYYYYYIPTSLKSVTITDTTQIPYGAFYSCSKLTSITILDSVTSIGDGAFWSCYKLTIKCYKDSFVYVYASENNIEYELIKEVVAAPNTPTVEAKTHNSVTLTATNGYEYKMDDGEWQSSNVFSDLNPNKTYTFYQRVAETEIAYASESSLGTEVTTLKMTIGDIDGDSELSDWDGVLLARYLAGWNVEIPTLDALDIDGDGEITDWDGVVLDRYIAGWDISIG